VAMDDARVGRDLAAADVRLTYQDAALGAVAGGRGPVPVLLFELAGSRTLLVTGAAPPRSSIAAVEAAISAGLPRWHTSGLGDRTVPAAGWLVRLGEGYAELHGPDRVWAHGPASPDLAWRTALANCAGHAIVLYGPMLGVRVPAGMRRSEFDARRRRMELAAAANAGAVAGAHLYISLATA
jgi:hypothetical protein